MKKKKHTISLDKGLVDTFSKLSLTALSTQLNALLVAHVAELEKNKNK